MELVDLRLKARYLGWESSNDGRGKSSIIQASTRLCTSCREKVLSPHLVYRRLRLSVYGWSEGGPSFGNPLSETGHRPITA